MAGRKRAMKALRGLLKDLRGRPKAWARNEKAQVGWSSTGISQKPFRCYHLDSSSNSLSGHHLWWWIEHQLGLMEVWGARAV